MYYIGCLSLSGYNIILLRLSPGVSFAVPLLTFVISAAQCRFWQCVGCSVLLRGVSSCLAIMQRRAFSVVGPSAWNDFPVELRSLLMTSLPNFTSPSSPSLAMTGPRVALSSSVLKRHYISLQNE